MMLFTFSFALVALLVANIAQCEEEKYAGSLASRALAMVNSKAMSAMMTPKMVVGDTAPSDMMKRSGITVTSGQAQPQPGRPATGPGSNNQTSSGQAALEGAKKGQGGGLNIGGLTLGGNSARPSQAAAAPGNGGGGLSIGGLTLGAPNGGISIASGGGGKGQPAAPAKGQQAAEPAAEPAQGQPAPADGQQAAAPLPPPAEGQQAGQKAGEAKAGEVAAVTESEQFKDNAGITLDKSGNAVNSGGDLGITKGSDGSVSVGGKDGSMRLPLTDSNRPVSGSRVLLQRDFGPEA